MTNLQPRIVFSLILICLLSLAACSKTEETKQAAEPQARQVFAETWEQFVTRQIEAHIAAHPQWAVTQGRHEYDGQLPDWSRAAIEKEIARLHQAREEALAFAEDQMNEDTRYQREYLISRLDQPANAFPVQWSGALTALNRSNQPRIQLQVFCIAISACGKVGGHLKQLPELLIVFV